MSATATAATRPGRGGGTGGRVRRGPGGGDRAERVHHARVELRPRAAPQLGERSLGDALIGDVGGENAVTFGVVMIAAALLGAVFAILMAILAPLAAVVYNAIVDLLGGFSVDLEEERE